MSRRSFRPHPFALGYVGSALLVGAVCGSFLELSAVLVFAGTLAVGAVVGAAVSWWRPGWDSVGWKLYPVALGANPVFVLAIVWSVYYADCLVGGRTGWACLFDDAGPDVIAACLPLPLVGLALRWLARQRSPSPAGRGSSPRLQ